MIGKKYSNSKWLLKSLSVSLIAIALTGCGNVKNLSGNSAAVSLSMPTPMEIDQKKIAAYTKEKGLETKVTETGLHYIIEQEGEGEHPTPYAVANVNYKGTFIDGTTFDSAEGARFQLNNVVDGWMQGVPLLKKGGKGLLILPSDLAYGAGGRTPNIEPHTILIFEVELNDFYEVQLSKDVASIEKYIAANNLKNMKKTKSGIHYQIEKIGGGWGPTYNSDVTVKYTGKLLDGTTFWSSYESGTPLVTKLNKSILAFGEILPMIREGGKVKMLVPSKLAYGVDGWESKIPPNAVLYYDLELVDVE